MIGREKQVDVFLRHSEPMAVPASEWILFLHIKMVGNDA